MKRQIVLFSGTCREIRFVIFYERSTRRSRYGVRGLENDWKMTVCFLKNGAPHSASTLTLTSLSRALIN